GAMLGAEHDTVDERAGGGDGHRPIHDLHFFMLLHRKHLPEPTHAARHHEHRAQQADAHVGHQPGYEHGEAEGEHDRPCRRRRKMNMPVRGVIGLVLSVFFHHPHLPTRYTTVKTTTHTASTKCQ